MPPLRRLLQKQTRLKTTSRTPSFRQPSGGRPKLTSKGFARNQTPLLILPPQETPSEMPTTQVRSIAPPQKIEVEEARYLDHMEQIIGI